VIYGIPSEKFLATTKRKEDEEEDEKHKPPPPPQASFNTTSLLENNQEAGMEPSSSSNTTSTSSSSSESKEVDLLTDILSGLGQTSVPTVISSSSSSSPPLLSLLPNPSVDASLFQAKWGALASGGSLDLTLRNPSSANQIEQLLQKCFIMTMASGTVQNYMKFYFYAQELKANNLFLIETVVDLSNGKLTANIRADNPTVAPHLLSIMKDGLASLL